MTKKKKGILIILGLLVFLTAWGLTEPYVIDIEEEEAVIKNLPVEWEGKEIAVLGDFQVGMWLDNTNTIRRMVDKLLEEEPSAILLTGDFVYHATDDNSDAVEEILELLRPLGESEIPVYAVLGNHDFALSDREANADEELAQRIEQGLETMGIDALQNETAVLESEESREHLHIVGIGSVWADNAAPERAFATIPEDAPRVLLMHNPDIFNQLPASTAPLTVAGHTHGGQMRVPFMKEWSYLALTQSGEVHADGWVDDYGAEGNRLYVNRGVGFSGLPLRINCAPEITMMTLRAE